MTGEYIIGKVFLGLSYAINMYINLFLTLFSVAFLIGFVSEVLPVASLCYSPVRLEIYNTT